MRQGKVLMMFGFALMVSSGRSFAEDAEWRQGDNSKVLPQYCQDRLDKGGRWKKWGSYFGPVSEHIHHYCGGIYAEHKAQSGADRNAPKWKRNYWLNEVVTEMRYVSRFCDPNCVVYSDLHRRWAWALTRLGKSAEAMEHVQLMSKARNGAGSKASPSSSKSD